MHADEFWAAFNAFNKAIGGTAADDTDNNGQIIIYTGLCWGDNDDVVEMTEEG